jgi:hypothetical protein
MPTPETGKQRASRIPLDYYKHRNALERWKVWLAGAGLLVPIGWLAAGLFRPDGGRLAFARGPVAAVHATWEDNCTACHEPFQPIHGRTWLALVPGHRATMDAKCQTCHAGPVHSAKASPELACADCHKDHRGRDAALARLDDRACTQCHADLAAHVKERSPAFGNVSRFGPKTHPPFKALRDDPNRGKLAFSHAVHMAAGMATKETGDPEWTLAKIPAEYRDRYRNGTQGDNERVQLACSSCHRLDPGDGLRKPSNGFPLAAGATMLPVTYESDCKACHPLTVNSGSPDARPQSLVTIPHGLQPDQVRDFLWGALAGRYAAQKPAPSEAGRRPMPGKGMTEQERKAREAIAGHVGELEGFLYRDRVGRAERAVFQGKQTCGECHGPDLPQGRPAGRIDPDVPVVWFQHAVFNHAAHRAVDCEACHAAARESTKSPDVRLIPGMETCQRCHAPSGKVDGKPQGGARFDCTVCHRYHHGSSPTPGIGAAARVPGHRLSIEEFLKGGQNP